MTYPRPTWACLLSTRALLDYRTSYRTSHARTSLRANRMSKRVDDIVTRFGCCSLAEQLHLLRVLPSLVSVDFISLLPSPTVVKILTFLSVEEVTICLRVSRSWYDSISHCKEYWLGVCNSVGLSYTCARDRSTKNVALSAWNHYRGIRRACLDYKPKIHVIPYACNEFYPSRGTQIVRNEGVESFKQSPNSFEMLRGVHYTMARRCLVMWAHRCDTKIVLATNDASWGVIHDDGGTQFWNDNAIVDLALERIGEACNRCGLVACVARSQPKPNFMVRLVCLHPGCSTANVQEYKCTIANQFALAENSFLHLESVSLVSSRNGSAQTESQLCREHYVLLQVGGAILTFVHRYGTERKLQPLHCYCPNNDPTTLTSAVFLGNRFRLSDDQCLVAMTSSNRLCVWDLRNRRTVCETMIPMICSRAHSWRCVAVGHLYALVCTDHSSDVIIVCVSNGRPLHKFKIGKHGKVAGKLFLLEQGWLNSIDLPITNNLNFVYTP